MNIQKNIYKHIVISVLIFAMAASSLLFITKAEENTYTVNSPEVFRSELLQPGVNYQVYKDLKGHWAEKYMNELSDMEILNGFVDKTMKPDKVITRSEFITMLVRVMDLKEDSQKYANYLDIPVTHWAYSYINRAKAYGLLDYFNDKNFYPNKVITREEIAIILSKALPKNFVADKPLYFNDIKDSYINKKALTELLQQG
ncbi:MAG TPA: S-layer homology domain-containing protein [Clostridiales bacterium]|nr:S-layer homology domain-containing protein [Clostridiales bacterium]